LTIVSISADDATLRLDRSELILVNNALNEISNGVNIADPEFETRMGATREQVRFVLDQIRRTLSAIENTQISG
jgi:hypothetical protein